MIAREGHKDDKDKPRMDLIPPEALFALGEVLSHGAKIYDERNWEKGMKWGRVFGALMRHAWKWARRETYDPDSGLPHTYHILACAAFLVAYESRGVGEDDRA